MHEITLQFENEVERDAFLIALSMCQCDEVTWDGFKLNFESAFECFNWDGQGNPTVSVYAGDNVNDDVARWIKHGRTIRAK